MRARTQAAFAIVSVLLGGCVATTPAVDNDGTASAAPGGQWSESESASKGDAGSSEPGPLPVIENRPPFPIDPTAFAPPEEDPEQTSIKLIDDAAGERDTWARIRAGLSLPESDSPEGIARSGRGTADTASIWPVRSDALDHTWRISCVKSRSGACPSNSRCCRYRRECVSAVRLLAGRRRGSVAVHSRDRTALRPEAELVVRRTQGCRRVDTGCTGLSHEAHGGFRRRSVAGRGGLQLG